MPDRPGRPRATSRETIAEAACELFLERGYDATRVVDITRRAGVARSSFFSYFSSKSDIVWSAFDERLDAASAALEEGADVEATLLGIGAGWRPDVLALALAQAEAMGLATELERERGLRRHRLARAVQRRLTVLGAHRVDADIRGAALAATVFAALEEWTSDPTARTLDAAIASALHARDPDRAGAVRQLRLVVRAEDWDSALTFYRDAVGMPLEQAYDAEGGARVAILDAGRATLELSNLAQTAYIDRVETDGDAPSDRLRIALEVTDTTATADRLVTAGAVVEASPRETPWRSVNARLRAPADLQLTIFQEPGPE